MSSETKTVLAVTVDDAVFNLNISFTDHIATISNKDQILRFTYFDSGQLLVLVDAIEEQCDKMGISNVDLPETLGVSSEVWNRFVRGEVNPTDPTLPLFRWLVVNGFPAVEGVSLKHVAAAFIKFYNPATTIDPESCNLFASLATVAELVSSTDEVPLLTGVINLDFKS